MARLPLISDDFVRRTGLPDGRNNAIFRDRKLTGFQLRIRRMAGGGLTKTYQVEHKGIGNSGRKVIVIGDVNIFTVEDARCEAIAILKAVSTGDDPKAIRRARQNAPNWETLVTAFDTDHIEEKAPSTQKDYRGRIRRNLTPFFKGVKIATVTPDLVSDFKRKKRRNPTDANRSLAVLSVMMNYAKAKAWCVGNPVVGIKRNKEKPREAWLDEIDLPKFLAVLQKRAADDAMIDLIRFLLISGWRVSEARLLRWEEVELPRLTAHIQTKTGFQARQLSTDAATIIDRQKHRIGFVFSGRAGRFPMAYKRIRAVLDALCAEAEINRITPHVLRHSSATWSAVNGADLLELRQAYGWKGLAMPNRYVSRAEALGRQGAQKAADAMNVLGKPAAPLQKLP
ncbi:site-specific integrase [Mesorhizobium sp. M1406]|uniref:site-specific integrase n=1 Tax=Mesorhizobium sp. M1406 TaxID=2957099 RepID=UPI00333B5037